MTVVGVEKKGNSHRIDISWEFEDFEPVPSQLEWAVFGIDEWANDAEDVQYGSEWTRESCPSDDCGPLVFDTPTDYAVMFRPSNCDGIEYYSITVPPARSFDLGYTDPSNLPF